MNSMYGICQITKIKIYVNPSTVNYKTMEQIQKELGCDYLINGSTFNGDGTPCCWLKVDGKLLHKEKWSDWGFGWNGTDVVMDSTANIAKYQNFISCVSMISPGPFIVPSEMGGCRGRTAIGLTSDGKVIPFCTKDGTKEALYPESLKAKMKELGATSALMLDGGISSRCMMPSGTISTNKKRPYLHNYIALWTHPVAEEPKPQNPQASNPQCPYAEPTHNVGRWRIFYSKDEARWVQWMLNFRGYSLDDDGAFGKLSDAALRQYQRDHGLVADGVCGKKTRDSLMGRTQK